MMMPEVFYSNIQVFLTLSRSNNTCLNINIGYVDVEISPKGTNQWIILMRTTFLRPCMMKAETFDNDVTKTCYILV